MIERQLTFIDVDENRFELWLKPDRIQLAVIDSRPELEAGELRRFASVLFTQYVGRELLARLGEARESLYALHAIPLAPLPVRELDDALRAIDAVVAAAAIPAPLDLGPERESEPEPPDDPEPEPEAPPPRVLTGRQPYPPLRPIRRGKRAREGSVIRWSQRRIVTAT